MEVEEVPRGWMKKPMEASTANTTRKRESATCAQRSSREEK